MSGQALFLLFLLVLAVLYVIRGWGAPPATEPTAGDPVGTFWRWWSANADRLAAEVDAGRAAGLAGELGAQVRALAPGLSWQLGPGRVARHSLQLSAADDPASSILLKRWLARAPAPTASWEYHRFKLAWGEMTHLELPGVRLPLAALRVHIEEEPSRERLRLRLHHPDLATLSEEDRFTAALTMLDAIIGEEAVERWVGGVRVETAPLEAGEDAASALPAHVARLAASASGDQAAILQGEKGACR